MISVYVPPTTYSHGGGGWPSGWGLVILVAYVVGVFVAWVPCARLVFKNEHPDGPIDIGMFLGFGLVMAMCWPFFLPGYWVYLRVTREREDVS